ncbi:enoyl-CoA hydratase-related protein [Geoalkalibacter subterraneus]|uniref:Crotonase n=1 Tax=Geoalkalibacter subterraneus TaxID=483547 RepID=A0A0B5FPB5_9BACT|nr:enoyl-CoA hydratase-related protein [Geoalkalibacter subterraneus]AJF05935.1 crotonase [Geoalkalibacter subterraneus]
MEDQLLLNISDSIATLTVNRPKVMNALSIDVLKALKKNVIELDADDRVRVIIITGAGEKAFIAGGDISAMRDFGPLQGRDSALLAQGVLNEIERCSKPVIAAVNGYALGGGCELSMACDLRVASENARFGQPEVNIGIIPGWGGSQRLPRLIGKGRALEMILTGEMIDAQEAWRIGLVNKVFPQSELMEQTRALAAKIAKRSLVVTRLSKEVVHHGMELDLARAQELEADLFGLCFSTHDQKEGMGAFLEKRSPQFKDA